MPVSVLIILPFFTIRSPTLFAIQFILGTDPSLRTSLFALRSLSPSVSDSPVARKLYLDSRYIPPMAVAVGKMLYISNF